MAILKIINRHICKEPILIDVIRVAYNKVKVIFDSDSVNNVDFLVLEYSIDNGASYITNLNGLGFISPIEIITDDLINIPSSTPIIFRLKSFSRSCSYKLSNPLTIIWSGAVLPNSTYVLPKPPISCQGEGDSPFIVWCQGSIIIKMSEIFNVSSGYVRFTSSIISPNPFSFKYTNGSIIPLLTSFEVNTPFELLYLAEGDNSSNYPWGNPNPYIHTNVNMQYSYNNIDWIDVIVTT